MQRIAFHSDSHTGRVGALVRCDSVWVNGIEFESYLFRRDNNCQFKACFAEIITAKLTAKLTMSASPSFLCWDWLEALNQPQTGLKKLHDLVLYH